jgi:hypothetical protein
VWLVKRTIIAVSMLLGVLVVGATGASAQDGGSGLSSDAVTCTVNERTITCSSGTWKDGTPVQFTIESTPVALGDVVAGANGTATLSAVVLPSSVTNGTHTLNATGISSTGSTITVSTQVSVGSSSVTASTTSGLPHTGASSHTDDYVRIGGGGLAVGIALVVLARRRRAEHTDRA